MAEICTIPMGLKTEILNNGGRLIVEYELEMDFYLDWILHLKELLETAGYTTSTEKEDISLQYFNLVRRLIRPVPLKVLIAKEFNYPPGMQLGLDLVKVKIEQGINDLARAIPSRNFRAAQFEQLFHWIN
jgi:hypothetical protein